MALVTSVVQVQSLAQDLPHAMDTTKKKKKAKQKSQPRHILPRIFLKHILLHIITDNFFRNLFFLILLNIMSQAFTHAMKIPSEGSIKLLQNVPSYIDES